jgi:hypothetical protein
MAKRGRVDRKKKYLVIRVVSFMVKILVEGGIIAVCWIIVKMKKAGKISRPLDFWRWRDAFRTFDWVKLQASIKVFDLAMGY